METITLTKEQKEFLFKELAGIIEISEDMSDCSDDPLDIYEWEDRISFAKQIQQKLK